MRIIEIEAAKKPGKPARGKYFLYPVAAARGREQRKSVGVNHPVKSPAERENESAQEYFPPLRSVVAAVAAVAATYAYFLIFAQFGFLRMLTAALGEGHALLRPLMAVMGVSGIAGSIAVAMRGRQERVRGWVAAGFCTAGLAAGLACVARTPPCFFAAAALTGWGTGVITVGLAAMIRRETGSGRLGLCLGLGTGLAYALCNLPPVFAATPRAQALLGIAAACTGLIAVGRFEQRAPLVPVRECDYHVRGVTLWTVVLLVLVMFDSAAFYVIQQTPALKAHSWGSGPQLLLNAAAHLGAGVLAGLALGRHWTMAASGVAATLLLGGHALIGSGRGSLGAPLYAAGVSAYSAVLVFYPARSGRAGLAALVYAVAGWTGSALGIGLAENGRALPGWLPAATGVLLAALLAALAWNRRERGCSKIL